MSRTMVHGIGVNDADYAVKPIVDGRQKTCPYYRAWKNMLTRCYSKRFHNRRPTYIGCTVCDEWLVFSVFKEWMEKQDWQGREIDKDILVEGNKIYSESNCSFVSQALNKLLSDQGNARGDLPAGVFQEKGSSRFRARCRMLGKRANIGTYDTPEDAHNAYRYAKAEAIRLTVETEDPADEIRTALLDRASKMIYGLPERKEGGEE